MPVSGLPLGRGDARAVAGQPCVLQDLPLLDEGECRSNEYRQENDPQNHGRLFTVIGQKSAAHERFFVIVVLTVSGQPAPPGFACRPALGRDEEVLERDVHERHARIRQHLLAFPEPTADVNAPALRLLDEGPRDQLPVDRDRAAVMEEQAPGDGGEAVPRDEQAADLVEEGCDEAAVDEARPALVALVEGERRLVAVGALLVGSGKVEADRVVAAAEAGRVVVRRDLQRRPPRSKWALKKFSEPDVAIEAEAEISSASVAAATICAKR
jgi:hypothetical protein